MVRTADSTSSTDAPRRAAAADRVPLGRVVGAHGLRGELRVRAGGDDVDGLSHVDRVWLVRDGEESGTAYRVAAVRSGRAGECRIALIGVGDRDAAQALRGCTVMVPPDDLPELGAGEYYAYQLVGCVAVDGEGRDLGTVKSVVEAGAHDVLVLADAAGTEQLVPAVEPLVARVDLRARRIVLDLPPGLLDPVG